MDALEAAEGAAPEQETQTCSKCGVALPRSHFSNKQWKRRGCCTGCVSLTVARREANEKAEPPSQAASSVRSQPTTLVWQPPASFDACYKGLGLRQLAPEVDLSQLQHLQSLCLGCNELTELPGLESLRALEELDISRNWFKALPEQLRHCNRLRRINASRNFLRPNAQSLRFETLAGLSDLSAINLRYNQKCDRQNLADQMAQLLGPAVDIFLTIWANWDEGCFEGASPAERDASQLRAQLEPWSTLVLRRRLVDAFGKPATDPESVGRAEVMRQLLACYEGQRPVIAFHGIPVRQQLCDLLLQELHQWANSKRKVPQERPTISAVQYMILRSPADLAGNTTRNAEQAAAKLQRYHRLWQLAHSAILEADAEFASKFTALAVTRGFTGSPHIDKQNIGPFYGLSLGDFGEGDGGVCVELTPHAVAHVNTRQRLGQVDGRRPHWVAPYVGDRFSLIYYQTVGEPSGRSTAVLASAEHNRHFDEDYMSTLDLETRQAVQDALQQAV